MNALEPFQPARQVPCKTYGEVYSQQASLEDILSGIIKVAGPVLQGLINQGGTPANNTNGSTTPPGASNAGAAGNGLPGILTNLLSSLLKGLGTPQVSKGQSLDTNSFLLADEQYKFPSYSQPASVENRFLDGEPADYARPFIFGIDDALIGTLIGPVLNVLPQLLNSANQHKLAMKQENNKLTSNILAGVNQRLLMQQISTS
jgi:hypothetical protein